MHTRTAVGIHKLMGPRLSLLQLRFGIEEHLGEALWRAGAEDVSQGDLRLRLQLQRRLQLHGRQGVASEVEEVFMDSNRHLTWTVRKSENCSSTALTVNKVVLVA